jgi:hypothetical protein
MMFADLQIGTFFEFPKIETQNQSRFFGDFESMDETVSACENDYALMCVKFTDKSWGLLAARGKKAKLVESSELAFPANAAVNPLDLPFTVDVNLFMKLHMEQLENNRLRRKNRNAKRKFIVG